MLEQAGLRVSRRSQWGNGPPPADVEVWLGDSVGEMPAYYAAADIGLLGGSFEPLGGQNLIEAAACGCPMALGPHTFEFCAGITNGLRGGGRFSGAGYGARCATGHRLGTRCRRLGAGPAGCAGVCTIAPRGCTSHGEGNCGDRAAGPKRSQNLKICELQAFAVPAFHANLA